jgi:hypothetical protein
MESDEIARKCVSMVLDCYSVMNNGNVSQQQYSRLREGHEYTEYTNVALYLAVIL